LPSSELRLRMTSASGKPPLQLVQAPLATP
jgi:hypothetical protein